MNFIKGISSLTVTSVAAVNEKVNVNAPRKSLVAGIDQLMRMAKAVVSPTFINQL